MTELFENGYAVVIGVNGSKIPKLALPTVAADVRASTAGAPVETVFFWASIAGMPHDLAARHVRTICAELAPRLACEDA